jgi:methionyl aminopeptidase
MLNNFEKSDLCWCGSQEEYKKCHAAFDKTIESYKSLGCIVPSRDIINIDISTIYQGYFSDSSRMFCIGKVDEKKEKLVRVVQECVELAIQQVKPWGFLGDIGEVIYKHAVKNGYSIVEDIGGHGVGLNFHEDPWISYVSKRGTEMMMVPGMIFTIEPMLNMGTKEIFINEENGWTYYTEDGQPSAQCEVMILVTNNGHEVLAS